MQLFLQATRQLSETDYNLIKEMFDIYDEDCNGFISKKELRKGLQRIGENPTEGDVEVLMSELAIKDEIRFDDFEKCMKVMLENDTQRDDKNKEDLLKAFKVFDKDGNGYIDKGELYKALKELGEKLTDEEIEEMFREADLNGDGKIDYHEFSSTLA